MKDALPEPIYKNMHTAPIKAILFDLDDTLWPIAPAIARAEILMHDWLRIHAPGVAKQFSSDQLRARRLQLLDRQPDYRINLSALRHAALTEVFLEMEEEPVKVDAAMAVFLQARNAVTLYEDVLPALLQLRGQIALGAISNGVADLETIGLAHYFDVALAAHRFGVCKPDSSIFQAACDALRIAPANAVYVGDDLEIDILGAQNAGMQAIWINRTNQTLPSHISPQGICTSLHELHAWLQCRTADCSQNDE